MAAREAALRTQLRLPTTLIERTLTFPKKTSLRPTQKTSSRPTKQPSLRPTQKPPSRPKAALCAAAVEKPALSLPKGPPHFAKTIKELKGAKIKHKRGAK